MSEEINTKYVVMIETNQIPSKGDCDNCEFRCPYYIGGIDKMMIQSQRSHNRIVTLDQFYCPIRAYIDLEEYLKWKAAGKTHEETAQIIDGRRERKDL